MEIKTLKNHAFRRILIALLSVMFGVLLWGYRRHIQTTNEKLRDWTAPLQELTTTLLSQSGSNDDSLIRSSIMQKEASISGLDLTPSVSNNLRRYMSNLYTVAWAFDAAKNSLPQTNDREYMFDRWTISLLQTNSLLSGDVLALYSGRETIQESIRYLSGAVMSTVNATKKHMSSHNLSVALASQIGVEVMLCTKSYDALANGRATISALTSWLKASYQSQLAAIADLTTNDEALMQCLSEYRQELTRNISDINETSTLLSKLTALSASRQRAYSNDPLQCPIGIDLYHDILSVRTYEQNLTELFQKNTLLENSIVTGNLIALQSACKSATDPSGTWENLINLLSSLSGDQQKLFQQTSTGAGNNNTGGYSPLPEDTQNIINDIYENNIKYIETMQQASQQKTYNPLQRLQELFKEFYGDTKQFIK